MRKINTILSTKVGSIDFHTRELSMKPNDVRGKFIKPTLKTVPINLVALISFLYYHRFRIRDQVKKEKVFLI